MQHTDASTRRSSPAGSRLDRGNLDVTVYLSTEQVPDSDLLIPRLTIAAPDLRTEDGIRELTEAMQDLNQRRIAHSPSGRWPAPIEIFGHGAFTAAQTGGMSTAAYEARAALMRGNVILTELPPEIAWNDKNAILKEAAARYRKVLSIASDWRRKQADLKETQLFAPAPPERRVRK